MCCVRSIQDVFIRIQQCHHKTARREDPAHHGAPAAIAEVTESLHVAGGVFQQRRHGAGDAQQEIGDVHVRQAETICAKLDEKVGFSWSCVTFQGEIKLAIRKTLDHDLCSAETLKKSISGRSRRYIQQH